MERLIDIFRGTFARAGAIAFLGEAVAHVAVITRLMKDLQDLSRWAFVTDWFFIVLGGYAALGMFVFWSQVRIKRCWSCFFYWFVAAFITGTVLLHLYIVVTNDLPHETLNDFPWQYSFLGLAYCLVFAWFFIRLKVVPREE